VFLQLKPEVIFGGPPDVSMNARQLEVFRAIMRNRTLTAAAAALNVSQPAVSKVIRHLESQIGYALFERVRGRLVPTAEAQLLFKDADRIFREIEVLKQFSNRIRDREVGLIRVAASSPPSFSILPAAIQRFSKRNPAIQVIVHTLPANEIGDQIIVGEVDLGVTMTTIAAPLVGSEIIGTANIVAVMNKASPLARLSEITPQALRDQVLISYGSQPQIAKLLDAAFEAAGAKRRPHIEVTLSITAAPMVQRDIGVALVDGLIPWERFGDLVVRPFKPQVQIPIALITSEAWQPSRFTKEFANDVRASLRDLKKERR
jgi:DNA-binding transcriptional LysR family regulator